MRIKKIVPATGKVQEAHAAIKIKEGEATRASALNIQLKMVQDSNNKGNKGQRQSLFQAQCKIKGASCKLIIDGGSCTNVINRALVAKLGLSIWRYDKPRHLEWLNNCGQIKITHKVHVPFSVGQYIDDVECDVMPLEVCGLLLGRP